MASVTTSNLFDSLPYTEDDIKMGLCDALKSALAALGIYGGRYVGKKMTIYIMLLRKNAILFIRVLEILDFCIRGQDDAFGFDIIRESSLIHAKITVPRTYLARASTIAKHFGLSVKAGVPTLLGIDGAKKLAKYIDDLTFTVEGPLN